MESRILAVADSYDAMTSHRVYKPPKSVREALGELRRCAGTQFDPLLVDVFLALQDQSLLNCNEARYTP
ncbi:HD-GYP domain-containing protein [Desulfofundulus sp. TPOSR]|uniref:HD-GYP domain-containing protein n=1 Tax=Desulfofundulus sp. TPOSR TaxID=2714340 RepID=UPI0037BF2370